MRKLAGILLCLCACVMTASADTTTAYYISGSYTAAIGSSQTFTFVQPNGTSVSALGSILSVSTVGGDANGLVYSNELCGSVSGGVDCFHPLLFTFTQPSKAFGFHDGDLTEDEEAVIIVNFASGDPSQTFLINLGGDPPFTPIFFGVVSSGNISSVEIYSRDLGSDAVGERANTIVDVIVPVSTPEPASLFLFGTGIAGVASVLRRKRRG